MSDLSISQNNYLIVRCEFSERSIVKQIGGIFDKGLKAWLMPLTTLNVNYLLDNLPNINLSDDFEEKVKKIVEKEERLEKIKRMAKADKPIQFKIPHLNEGIDLFNYQKLGVLFALTTENGVLLADDMGLGKSSQSIATAVYKKYKEGIDSCLVITLASLKFNFPLEIKKFTNESYVVIDGKPEERIRQWNEKAFFYVTNYETIVEDLFGGKNFEIDINDNESQVKKKKAKKEKANLRYAQLENIRKKIWGCIITDECLHGDSKIELADGTKKGISEIVKNRLPLEVLSYNFEKNIIEPKKIINWFQNSTKQCYGVYTDSGVSYTSMNHKYMTPKGYEELENLKKNDTVLYLNKYGMSSKQIDIMAGTVLGDGYLSCKKLGKGIKKFSKKARIKWTHGLQQSEYLKWKAGLLGDYKESKGKSGFTGKSEIVCTGKSIIGETFYNIFYKNGKKTVSQEWLDLIGPLGLAFWYMDDGSVAKKQQKNSKILEEILNLIGIANEHKNEIHNLGWRRIRNWFKNNLSILISEARSKIIVKYFKNPEIVGRYKRVSNSDFGIFHTEGFTFEENVKISTWLKEKFNIDNRVSKAGKYYNIQTKIEGFNNLCKLISKYVHPSLRYKLGSLENKFESFDINSLDEDFQIKPRIMKTNIHCIKPYKKPCATYDIEVEDNHNFFTGGNLVSNCHALKSHDSKRSRACKQLKAHFKMGLTGTPMDGRLEELHSIYEFLLPGLFESKTSFLEKHATFDWHGKVTGYKNIGVVKKKIQPFFLRRLKEEVLKDLPPKIYVNRYIEMNKEQKTLYNEIATRAHAITEDSEAMTALLRAKQLCDHPRLLELEGESCKLASFKELLEEVVLQNGQKAIVFSQYTKMCEILIETLKEMGLKYLYICGDTPKQDRVGMQQQFNEDKSIDIIIGTDAMSTGLNLTGASYVINYDDYWSPSIMDQRSGRAHRIGQKSTVTVCNFIIKDTIEERIRDTLYNKSKISSDVLGDNTEETLLKRLGPQDLAKLL